MKLALAVLALLMFLPQAAKADSTTMDNFSAWGFNFELPATMTISPVDDEYYDFEGTTTDDQYGFDMTLNVPGSDEGAIGAWSLPCIAENGGTACAFLYPITYTSLPYTVDGDELTWNLGTFGNLTITDPPVDTPEPGVAGMLLLGLVAIGLYFERKPAIILKGGGYSHGGFMHGIAALRPRHRHWTGTNDDVPRTNGVPPIDGGLSKPPNPFKRVWRWISYYFRLTLR